MLSETFVALLLFSIIELQSIYRNKKLEQCLYPLDRHARDIFKQAILSYKLHLATYKKCISLLMWV